MADHVFSSPSEQNQSSRTVLRVEDVDFFYHRRIPILRGLNIGFGSGMVALIGPNGAGKSTLLHLLSGWLKPCKGEVFLEGTPMRKHTRGEIARTLGVVPQREEQLFPFSVTEVVELGLFAHGGFLGRSVTEEQRQRIQQLLVELGIQHLGDTPITECSGGERQLALVARALVCCPRILLLDEPTTWLDPLHQRVVLEMVREWQQGAPERLVIMVTHDLSLALSVAERVVLLNCGEVAYDGTPNDLLQNGLLEEVYRTTFELSALPGRQVAIHPRWRGDGEN